MLEGVTLVRMLSQKTCGRRFGLISEMVLWFLWRGPFFLLLFCLLAFWLRLLLFCCGFLFLVLVFFHTVFGINHLYSGFT